MIYKYMCPDLICVFRRVPLPGIRKDCRIP